MKIILVLTILAAVALIEAKREPRFAPYIDVTRLDEFKLVDLKNKYGVKAFSLAFALGGAGGCVPWWGGQVAIDDPTIIKALKALKAAGGDVIVSTGGALGPYLEHMCATPSALVNAYKKILSVTGSTHLDIDIEATVNADNMNQALAQLQRENPDISVSFTLMVQGDDYGVTLELGVNVLKNAVKHGVNVDIVNPMTMEFGTSRASWGDAVIAAAEATHKQMKQVWPQKSDKELYSMLGVTPMLGRNFNGKIFTQQHAQQLVNWAKQKQIGHLGFWSINRDRACPGKAVDPSCSSIDEKDHEFTKIFANFN
ncbi:chitinase-like [Oppia nitens]|uniref:chitinase-like n=1 Tax=Oppia nitens TaxID=1686743 RepID=UPI0023DCA060|nr:chitinase-like [Oppia nitens]